jgi:hypothetical protein
MADSIEPQKETVHTTVSPQPSSPPSAPAAPAKPAIQMKKAQRLIDLPAVETPATTVTVTAKPQLRIDQIPMALCWVLLATSVAILILQIWNYLS